MKQWHALSATAQDVLIALFLFSLGTVFYLSGLYPMARVSTESGLAVRFTILGALCGAAVLRRRMPGIALVAGVVPLVADTMLGSTVPVWLVYSDLIYAAVLYGSRTISKVTAVASAVMSLAIAVAVWIGVGDWHAFAIAIAAAFAFVGTPVWWGLQVRQHKEIAAAEHTRAEAMTLVAELDRRAAIADERKTMARDLHDVIAGHLSAIAIQSEAALGVLSKSDIDPKVTGILASIRSNSVSALHEMRTMIGLLRDDGADEDIAAPRKLAQLPILVDAARAAGISVRVQDSLNGTLLPSAVDQAAYRIIQEALTNAMKHAPGQPVYIDVREQEASLVVTVRNPTTGSRPEESFEASAQRGLMNMRERAAALGGTFTAEPADGRWEVLARLPISAT
ncbi:histidine kinase [Nocardia sp. XZ_19_385]|uniref:sensor histidine kinase n=1 Tax=Nocardia sp. XZ_19_385 TaxID=2769488 RepID=UPI002815CE84|nr:histidine kinase [Nocardia sp. XZ_19_385]